MINKESPRSIALGELCRMFEQPEFHIENHPQKEDIVLFTLNPDFLLGRFPDGPVTGRFVVAHLHFCQSCQSVVDEVEKRRKEFEIEGVCYGKMKGEDL